MYRRNPLFMSQIVSLGLFKVVSGQAKRCGPGLQGLLLVTFMERAAGVRANDTDVMHSYGSE